MNSIHMLLTNVKGEKNREGGRAREGEAQEEEMNKRTEVVLLNKCITNHDSNVLNNEDKSMGEITPCTDMLRHCTHTDEVLATATPSHRARSSVATREQLGVDPIRL